MKQFKKFAAIIAITATSALSAHAADMPDLKPATIKQLPAGTYGSDPYHTSLTWKVSHMGLSHYTARFKKVDAVVTLDPADITKSKVTATIDPNSIETDYVATKEEDFNKKLSENADWLNSKKFPQIKFESTKIEKTSETTGLITGNLTFLGVTKPVVLDTTFVGGLTEHPFTKQAAFGISAKGKIKRSDFGFAGYIPVIGDEVTIQIESEFGQKVDAAKSDAGKAKDKK